MVTVETKCVVLSEFRLQNDEFVLTSDHTRSVLKSDSVLSDRH